MFKRESILEKFFDKIQELMTEKGIIDQRVKVKAQALTPEQAIGNPDSDDYPILKGREKMMKTSLFVPVGDKKVSGIGQAFTDHYGDYEGTLKEIFDPESRRQNNFRRAIALAAANAFLQALDLIKGAIHCKDKGPGKCGEQVIDYIRGLDKLPSKRFNSIPKKILVIGHQPRLIQNLSTTDDFELKALDLDPDNFGLKYGNCVIESPKNMAEYLVWCDMIFATGSTFVNDSAQPLVDSGKDLVFYGISGAGVCSLMDFERYCPESTD